MGAWGTGPFENDGALEFTDKIDAQIDKAIAAANNAVSDDTFFRKTEAAFAAIGLIVQRDYYPPDIVWDAVRVLDRLIAFESEHPDVAGWIDPGGRQKTLRSYRQKLDDLWKKSTPRRR